MIRNSSLPPSIEEIENIFDFLFESTKKSSNISDAEAIEYLKPFVLNLLHDPSQEQKKDDGTSIGNDLLRGHVDIIAQTYRLKIAQKRFVEQHQFTRLGRLFNIRQILMDYFVRYRRPQCFHILYSELKSKCDFALNKELLKRWITELGFEVKTQANRSVIVEQHDQHLARVKYLRAVDEYRQQQRNILYFREATIDCSRWNTEAESFDESVIKRLTIVVFAANENGLLNFAFIDENALNKENFTSWLKALMSSQEKNSLIILDSKPFNRPFALNYLNKAPALPNRLQIIKHLSKQGSIDDNIFTVELLDQLSKKLQKNCAKGDVTKVMNELGHDVLHLPPNHSELNPLYGIDFRLIFNGHNAHELSDDEIKTMIRNRLDSSTADEWKQYFDRMRENEQKHKHFELVFDDDIVPVDDDINDGSESDIEIIEVVNDVIQLSDEE